MNEQERERYKGRMRRRASEETIAAETLSIIKELSAAPRMRIVTTKAVSERVLRYETVVLGTELRRLVRRHVGPHQFEVSTEPATDDDLSLKREPPRQ